MLLMVTHEGWPHMCLFMLSVDMEPARSKLFCYCCMVVNICTNWRNACQQNAEILSVVIKWETFLLNCPRTMSVWIGYNNFSRQLQPSLLFCKRTVTIPCGILTFFLSKGQHWRGDLILASDEMLKSVMTMMIIFIHALPAEAFDIWNLFQQFSTGKSWYKIVEAVLWCNPVLRFISECGELKVAGFLEMVV
jgi:hypothetical protein